MFVSFKPLPSSHCYRAGSRSNRLDILHSWQKCRRVESKVSKGPISHVLLSPPHWQRHFVPQGVNRKWFHLPKEEAVVKKFKIEGFFLSLPLRFLLTLALKVPVHEKCFIFSAAHTMLSAPSISAATQMQEMLPKESGRVVEQCLEGKSYSGGSTGKVDGKLVRKNC